MKKTLTFTITWRHFEKDDFLLTPENKNFLEDEGFDRAVEMYKDGYINGELCSMIQQDDKEIEMSGWWDLKKMTH